MKMKRFVSGLILAAMVLTLLPVMALAATDETTYKDENGNIKTVTATVVDAMTSTLTSGWYVVKDSISRDGTITVSGDVHLIIADGASLTVDGSNYNAGINVSGSNSLTIYGQKQGTAGSRLHAAVAARVSEAVSMKPAEPSLSSVVRFQLPATAAARPSAAADSAAPAILS